jgi:hypothetical protein
MDPKLLAPHILSVLALAQRRGDSISLETICSRVSARRGDLRVALSDLHREGHVDVLRMRLTMTGFALALALPRRPLRERRVRRAA